MWPRRRTIKELRVDWLDLLAWLPDFSLTGLLASVVVILTVGVLIAVFLPLLVLLGEFLLAGVGAALFFRPWRVVARSHDEAYEWRIRGWRRSRRAMKQLAARIASGEALDPTATIGE